MIQPVDSQYLDSSTYRVRPQKEIESGDIVTVTDNYTIEQNWRQTNGSNGQPPVISFMGYSSVLNASFNHLSDKLKDLNKNIKDAFVRFHSGSASSDEIKELFDLSYETMVKIHEEIGYMDKASNPDEFKSRILGAVLTNFQYYNGQGALNASVLEGEGIAGSTQITNEGSHEAVKHWSYYNAKFHYQEKDMFNFLTNYTAEFTNAQGLTDPIKSMPNNSPFFHLQYNEFTRIFHEDYDPPKDFSTFMNLDNKNVSISGVDDIADINKDDMGYTDLQNSISKLDNEKRESPFMRYIIAYLYRETGEFMLDIKDHEIAFTTANQYSRIMDAYCSNSQYENNDNEDIV